MKKMKLTERWKNRIYSLSSDAMCGHIHLQCYHLVGIKNQWSGSASISIGHKLVGPARKSIKAAQQDAERLAVELLRDIRDATKALMDQYEMGEDD